MVRPHDHENYVPHVTNILKCAASPHVYYAAKINFAVMVVFLWSLLFSMKLRGCPLRPSYLFFLKGEEIDIGK